ncbi:MFS-type transporter SLC18B1-like [Diadema antillarum]|uniref:MFS-type transporter SLC18B1-like n=1 Tax=Diadema antillarum TaxID=105358 RepID=UPI003A87016A
MESTQLAMENHNSNNSKASGIIVCDGVSSISGSFSKEADGYTLLGNRAVVENEEDCIETVVDSKEDEGAKKGKRNYAPMSRRDKMVYAGLAVVSIADLMLYSVLAPFFPIEAAKKGVSTTVSGLVFGVYALVGFVSSPIIGKYVGVFGPKFLFFSGTFVCAGCNILFGVLDEIDDKTTFITFCFVLRSIEAIGSSAALTACLTIVATMFPDRVTQMTGTMEMFNGLGLMIGPALGSLFYKIGGYKLPFLVLGGIDLTVLIIVMFLLPKEILPKESTRPGSILRLMMIPAVWPMILAILVGSTTYSLLDPTLSLHLKNLGVSTPVAGTFFLLIGGLYAITMPLWGYLSDRTGRTRLMTLVGFFFLGVAYLLLGPAPILHIPQSYNSLWIVVISLCMIGVSIGCACMPIFLDLLVTARWYGFPEDMSTNGLTSGVFGGCFNLGNFLGPVLGGVLKDTYGFDWAATVFALCCFSVVIWFGAFCLWEFQCGKGRRKPWIYFGDKETGSSDPESSGPKMLQNGAVSINASVLLEPESPQVRETFIDSYTICVDSYLDNGLWIDQVSDKRPLIVDT